MLFQLLLLVEDLNEVAAPRGGGCSQVYIRPFPSGSGVWKVSVDVGREPRWRADGKILYFNGRISFAQATLMAAAVNPDGRGGLQLDTPQRLFEAPVATRVPQANVFTISPHPDGQRFLVNMVTDTTGSVVNVVTSVHKLIANREAENSHTN